MKPNVLLRNVIESDLRHFFRHQQDKESLWMAAFTAKDPSDEGAFTVHWKKILGEGSSVHARTIVKNGQVVGHVLSYPSEGHTEVTYWIAKECWGQGIATQALAEFMTLVHPQDPLYARAARDNHGSRRVLEKCGFAIVEEARGYANARQREIDELVFARPAPPKA